MLRRQAVDLLRPHGILHLHVGKSPTDYLVQLALPADAVVHTSTVTWLGGLIKDALLRRCALVYSPGPQFLNDSVRVLAGEVARLVLTVALRVMGLPVIRLSRSFEDSGRFATMLVMLHTRVLSLSFLRDSRAPDPVIQRSKVLPDLAVRGARPLPEHTGTNLAVSLRFDNGMKLPLVAERISELANRLELTPLVVSQVSFDEPRQDELASLLQAKHVRVTELVDPLNETLEVYSSAAVVLSDRLHALIFGLLNGAMPVQLNSGHPDKVSSALSEIGIVREPVRLQEVDNIDANFVREARAADREVLRRSIARLRQIDLDLAHHLGSEGKAAPRG
jgi:hypothetical protein